MNFDKFAETIQNNAEGYTPEKTANMILEEIGYNSQENCAVPIIDIAKRFGFHISALKSLPNNDSGFLFVSQTQADKENSNYDKLIIVSEKIKYGKSRFVIAHEIGHYLFDYKRSNNDGSKFVHTFTKHYNKDSHKKAEEGKINEFASCLLMPENRFKAKYYEEESKGRNSEDIVKALSLKFGVTDKAIKERIKELQLA